MHMSIQVSRLSYFFAEMKECVLEKNGLAFKITKFNYMNVNFFFLSVLVKKRMGWILRLQHG